MALRSRHSFIEALGVWGIALPIMHTGQKRSSAYTQDLCHIRKDFPGQYIHTYIFNTSLQSLTQGTTSLHMLSLFVVMVLEPVCSLVELSGLFKVPFVGCFARKSTEHQFPSYEWPRGYGVRNLLQTIYLTLPKKLSQNNCLLCDLQCTSTSLTT